MNIAPFEIDPGTARNAFLEYRAAVAAKGSPEDEAIMRGYKAIASGQRVIALQQVLKAGGVKPNGYPNLAISRADRTRVAVDFNTYDSECHFLDFDARGRAIESTIVRVAVGTFPCPKGPDGHAVSRYRVRRAMVPSIPPRFRPPHDLRNYHILFEVESWEILPPVDPALLRHLGGGLYAVLAVWDLTDLERAVIGITRG